MSSQSDNQEIYQIIRENLVRNPSVANDELAKVSSDLIKRPVSIRRIARIRKQVTPTLAMRHKITFEVLSIHDLHPEHGSISIYAHDLDDKDPLVVSVREHGIIEPLIVSPEWRGFYRIIDGVRRFWVLVKLGVREVPCIVYPETTRKRRLEMNDIVTTRYKYLFRKHD